MVRPIEISDSLSKTEAVQRLQQTQKAQLEAAQQFQKTLGEKLTEEVKTPKPVSAGDHVVLHVDESEREKRKTAEDEESQAHEHHEEELPEEGENSQDQDEDSPPHEHIDIKA